MLLVALRYQATAAQARQQRKELSRRKEIFAHDDKLKLTGDARNGRRRIPTLEEDSEVMSTKRDEQRKQLEI